MIDIGYEHHHPKGSMRVMGALEQDEVFTCHPQGSVNISAMWRDITSADADAAIHSVFLNETALWALEHKDVDKDTLARMTADRAEVPVLLIGAPGREASLIDGTHRLTFRYQRGDKMFLAWFFPESAWETYRVEIYLALPPASVIEMPKWERQSPAAMLRQSFGTYAQRNERGQVIGIRDERRTA